MQLFLLDEYSSLLQPITLQENYGWEKILSRFSHSSERRNTYQIGIIPTRHLTRASSTSCPIISFSQLLEQVLTVAEKTPQGTSSELNILLPYAASDEIILLFAGLLPEEVMSCCRRILDLIRQSTGIALHIGLGQPIRDMDMLSHSLSSARKNAASFNLFAQEEPIHSELPYSSLIRPYNLSDQEDQLYASILNGSDASIRTAVEELTHQLFQSGFFCLRQLNRLEILYHGMRINWMDKFHIRYPQAEQEFTPPDFYFSFGFDRKGDFSPILFQKGLCEDLKKVAQFYQMLSGQKDAGLRFLDQVREYINFSYNLPLSQQKIAEQFYVSASYLSHAFKNFYGIGMTQYINQVRIDKAKELLEDRTLSIRQISIQTGFRDEKYFSRVFQRVCGCSPSEYRKQLISRY